MTNKMDIKVDLENRWHEAAFWILYGRASAQNLPINNGQALPDEAEACWKQLKKWLLSVYGNDEVFRIEQNLADYAQEEIYGRKLGRAN